VRSDRQLEIQWSPMNVVGRRSLSSRVSRLDSFVLKYNSSINVPFNNLSIAWSTDKAVKFKNPDNPSQCEH
jgi:hypothetical protein